MCQAKKEWNKRSPKSRLKKNNGQLFEMPLYYLLEEGIQSKVTLTCSLVIY
jgi:hypothetical protein